MRRRDEIDVCRALFLQFEENLCQALCRDLFAVMTVCNIRILAKNASECASCEKDRSRADGARNGRFLPKMERGTGSAQLM